MLRADAPLLFDGLSGAPLPVIVVSVVAGLAADRAPGAAALRARPGSLGPRRHRRSLIGWAVAQYPYLLVPYLTIEEAAASRATLVAMTVVLVLGSLVLVPALVYMFVLFSRPPRPDAAEPEPPSGRDHGAREGADRPKPGRHAVERHVTSR